MFSNSNSKPWLTQPVNNPQIYHIYQWNVNWRQTFKTASHSRSTSGKVDSCFTFKLQIVGLFELVFFFLFLGPRPSGKRSRWPGSAELSRKHRIAVDLIWSSMWTHEGPQLDLSLPQHAITVEPNMLISYIKSCFPKVGINHYIKHC